MTVTPSAATGVRLAVDGVQVASGTSRSVPVGGESDVHITLTDANGAITTYVVHCLIGNLWGYEATKTAGATGVLEDLILLFLNAPTVAMLDNNAVPRFHRNVGFQSWAHFRVERVTGADQQQGQDLEYRYWYVKNVSHAAEFTVLDQNLQILDSGIGTVAPLQTTDQHDFRILPNGNYLLLAYEPAQRDLSGLTFNHPHIEASQPQQVRDAAIQIITPDGQAVFTWNSWGIMPLEDCTQEYFAAQDDRGLLRSYAHINSLQMIDGLIIASFRGCSKVLAIDPNHTEDHKVAWRLGRSNLTDAQWETRGVGPAPLAIVGDPAEQFCGQHAAQVLPNGNLILYDNGTACLMDPWTGEAVGRASAEYSRAVEYTLDHDSGEAVFVRDHSLRSARRYVGYFHGQVEPLANGDWLISWGRPHPRDATDDSLPVDAVTQVDPDTGVEKFSLRDPDNKRRHSRAIPLHPVALFREPGALAAELPASDSTSVFHGGSTDAPQVVVSFSRPVVDFAADTPSVSVSGATVASVSPHLVAGEPANAYLVTLTPDGDGAITFSLVANEACADGGICTADGTLLTSVPTALVIGGPVTVEFGQASYTVAEGGTVEVTVTLSAAHQGVRGITVPIVAEATTTASAGEFSLPASVTFNAGDTSKSFMVTTVQDTVIEEDEELILSLGTLPTGVNGTNSAVVITVMDDDDPEWALTLRRGSTNVTTLTEGGADAVALLRITNGVQFEAEQIITLKWGGDELGTGLIQERTGSTFSIDAGASNGSAVIHAPDRAGDLYRLSETKTLTAHIGNDQVGDGIELSYVDDEAPPVFAIRLRDTRVVEGSNAFLDGTLSRGYDTSGSIVLLHALATGATTRLPVLAQNAIDGQPAAPLSFLQGETTSGQASMTATGNTTAGDHATITFTIPSNPDYYTIGSPSTATLLVLDDDAAPSAPRSISARPGDAQAAIRWTRPANSDQVWISDYQYRQRAGNGAWTTWATIPGSDGTTTNHTFTGLTNQTEYTFEVRARNSNHNGAEAQVQVTPSPRPPTTVSITASVSEPVRAPFRVTITFTDQDMDGMDTDGIEGFEADDIIAYYNTRDHGSYEFRVTDFREETPGKVYSALVDKIIDGRLRIEVEENAVQSTLDGAGNTAGLTAWQVDAPALPSAPEGETIWSDNLRIGGAGTGIGGYFLEGERYGELPNANFSYNGTDYEIDELSYTNSWRTVRFRICPTLEGADSNFWLHLGEDSKAVSFGGDYLSTRDFRRTIDGTQLDCKEYNWVPIQLNWPSGQSRNVKITVTQGTVAERPLVTSVALTSNPNNDGRPGSDYTYAIGDSVTATVTFDKAVDVTGSSEITLLFGTAEKTAACAAATNTRRLACSYEVAAGDTAPDGVGIKANSLLLDGGTIYAAGSLTTRANLAHDGLGLQSGHKVDGIRPTLITTGADAPRTFSDGIRIQLTFNENIEEATPSLFTIEGNNVELPLGNQVSINARTVVLRLATALTDTTASLTVTLDAEAVEDVPGNANLARSAVTLLNNVGVAPTGPDAPTGLTATPAPDETPQLAVTLTWTAPASDGGSAIRSHQYRYSRNSGEFGSWTTIPNSTATGVNATSYTVKGLSAVNNQFTTFQFQVRAVNEDANGSESDQASTFITTPSNLQVVDVTPGDKKIELNWDTPDNGGSKILRYVYSVHTFIGNVEIVAPGTTMPGSNADTTSFTVTGLTNGVHYDVRIRAVNSVGPAPTWQSSSITPATFPTAPRNLGAEPGDTQVTLRWTAPLSDGGKVIEEYQYQQKTGDSAYGSWTTITGSDENATGHDVTGLTNGTSYSFKVRAKNSVGEGPESNEVTVVPVTGPSAPTGLTATPAPDEKPQLAVTLTWTAPTDDGGSAIRSHQYRYSRNSGNFGSWTTIPNSSATGANATSFTVRGLSAVDNMFTTFQFQVRAVNVNANGSESNTVGTFIDVPFGPVNLEGTAGDRRVELTWDTPDNGGSKILKYQYAVTDLHTNTEIIPIHTDIPGSNGDTTSFTVTGLTNGVLYDIRVNAVNTVGPGTLNLIQGAAPATFPTAPRNLRAEAGDTQVTLRWTAPLYNGGYDISGYEYQQKTGTGNFGSWMDITGADDTTTEHTVTGLTNGTSYSFKVRAKNLIAGEGPASNEATADPITVPSAPQSFTATAGNAKVTLDWTAPASDGGNAIVSYEFRYQEGSGSFTTWATVPGSDVNTTTHTVRNLTNGTVHTFEVRAATATHKGVSASAAATPMAVKPDKPSVTVESRPEALSVSWSVSDDGGSDITEYQVQWKSGSGSFGTSNQQTGLTTTNTLIENLTNGTDYDVRVRAMNTIGWSDWSDAVTGTPRPRPAPSVSITASVSQPVTAPFRVTITFTDQDLDGNDTDGVRGFEADDIIAYYTNTGASGYEFRITDLREETPGKVYSALVDKIIDGKLTVEVEENAAQSKLDGQGNTSAYTSWQVDAPDLPSAPEGETVWSDTLTLGGAGTGTAGYFVGWSPTSGRDERFGSLPNANFTYNGTDYEIDELSYTEDLRTLRLRMCPRLEGADSSFWLHIGDGNKAVSFGADYMSTREFRRTIDGTQLQCREYNWEPIDLDWQSGQTRSVKITR